MNTQTMVCIADLEVPATQLDDYFDFQRSDDIRLKGTRVGIETILYDFIHRCRTPEEIVQSYPSLTLEQVYATILYYHRHKEAVSKYIADWLEYGRLAREEQERNPPQAVIRLRKIKAEREAAKRANESSVSNG
ncbi:MAG: DUF433 domain-containing protein [Leptolyngbyaceae cyanobacterium bins.302]|nr:DUF433 domain-containing protein [Leptolyngbyaceae cyanobacterium bins.302]